MEQAGMDKLHQQLNKVSRRLRLVRWLSGTGYGSLAAFAMILLWLAAGRVWPIHFLGLYAALSGLLCIIAGGMWGLLLSVPKQLAARTMDYSTDEGERQDAMVTALSFAGNDSYAARLQREQATRYGAEYVQKLKRHLPAPRPPRRLLIAACCAAMAVGALVLMPNPMDKVLERERQQQAWIESQLEETGKILEELEASELEPLVKAPLREELVKLRQELANAEQPEEALRSLEESMKQLQEMAERQELQEQQRSEWLDAWRQTPKLEGLGRALEQQDTESISEELDKLKEQLPKLSAQEKERLAEALSQLADQLPQEGDESKRLAEALRKAAENVSENQNSADIDLSELAAALEEEMKSAGVSGAQATAAADLASALAQQGLGMAEQMSAAGFPVSDTWSMGGSAEQWASAAGNGASPGGEGDEGNGGMEGQSPGSGQGGNGQSQGGQGSGNGQGSGSGGTGQGQGQGQGQGAGAGLGSGSRSLVTTPRESAGSGNVEVDTGPTSGGQVQKGGQGPVFDGASRPYEEVYSDYEAEAKRALNRGELPQSLQGLVESYFTEIDPGN
ncbi:DUF2721 domain-containing protein [Paenibacillus senegalimassiliensis]|uniref:hypothetical protein n=1 Tax=Paenibacillus senegalimassiliensis TaxID=1737426 RepID=UPI00073F9D86|nr:hypothetical protein [Paenibacillus senegalimassiliensis]